MAIRLEIKEYCMDCLEFEADVRKPERTILYGDGKPLTIQSDTVVRCKYAPRCHNLVRYLNRNKEDKE